MSAATSPTTRSRPHPRRLLIGVLVVLLWLAGAAWAFASPTLSSPDDDYHLARIYCAAGVADCSAGGVRTYPCFAWQPGVSGDCLPREAVSMTVDTPKALQPSGSLLVPPTDGISDGRPALYETVMAPLVGDTLDRTSSAVRLANVTLAVLMAAVSVWLTAPALRRAVALSWVAVSVPLGLFMISSVNAHAWTLIGLAAVWGPLLTLLRGHFVDRMALVRTSFCALAAVLSFGSRSESPVYLVAIVAAVAVLGAHRGGDLRHRRLTQAVLAGVLLLSAAAFLALSWNRVDFLLTVPSRNPDAGVWDAVVLGLDRVASITTAPLLGWLDTGQLPLVAAMVSACVGGLIIVGLGQVNRRKVAAVAVIAAACLLVPALMVMRGDSQPRYFLPLLTVLVGLLLVPVPPGPRLPDAVQGGVILALLAGANGLALLTTLQRFIGGSPNGPTLPTDHTALATPGWWTAPVPPGLLALIGTAAFAGAMALLWFVLWRVPVTSADSDVVDVRTPSATDTADADPARQEPEIV